MTRIALCATAIALLTSFAAGQAPKARKYALLVGVRSYDHSRLTDLKFTENDAEGMAGVLKQGGYDEVVVLTTTRGAKDDKAKPSRANIDRELKRLLAKVTKHDVMLVGLAGHGVQYEVKAGDNKKRDESFFCPSDAKLIDSDDYDALNKTMLSFRDLFKRLDDSGAGSRLLLVDACRNDAGSTRNADTDAMPRPAKGTAALFACKGGEKAHESAELGKGHGVFFYHVIEALEGAAKNEDGGVTWDDLTRHVRRAVVKTVPRVITAGARQTPHLMANVEGDPVLLAPGGTAEAPWVRLFDGKSLKGWKTHPTQPGQWKVLNGVLIGSGPVSHLFTQRDDFDDFHARVEFRLNAGGNSGLYFRSEFGLSRGNTFPEGYEAQMLLRKPLIKGNTTGTLTKFCPGKDTVISPDKWVTLEVLAKGNHIVIKVDGVTTVDFVDEQSTYKRGHLALQLMDKGSIVQIRKLEVKKLTKK